jgi:hypothetical protein
VRILRHGHHAHVPDGDPVAVEIRGGDVEPPPLMVLARDRLDEAVVDDRVDLGAERPVVRHGA